MKWILNILRRGNHGVYPVSLIDCLSLDLEVGRHDHRIHTFAAVAPGTGGTLFFDDRNGRLDEALSRLDDLAEGKAFVLGHNLIHFDLSRLRAVAPHLRLHKMPAVDTLMLNPLAFPQNPYHYLVKHYQDGQLRRGRINDPELDARLTLEVFENQQGALRDKDVDLLTTWHWLTTVNGEEGFDIVFSVIRQAQRRSDRDAGSPRRRGQIWQVSCLCAGVALGRRWQLRDAALGETPVSRDGPSRAPPARHPLPGLRLRLVSGET